MSAEIEVTLFDSMNVPPASQLAVEGWLHGERNGFGSGELNMHHSYKAFVATIKDGVERAPVGVLTWDDLPSSKTMWIYQAFVVEDHRGEGVFTEMLNHAIAEAMRLKLVKIQLGTSVKNMHAREAYRKTGFAETSVTCTLEVPTI